MGVVVCVGLVVIGCSGVVCIGGCSVGGGGWVFVVYCFGVVVCFVGVFDCVFWVVVFEYGGVWCVVWW